MNENIDSIDVNQNSEQYKQPLKIGDILDSIFALYRNNYKLYLSIALIYFIALLLEYSLKGFIPGSIQGEIIPVLISMPFGIIAISAGVYATGSLYLEREISADDIFKRIFHRLVPLIGSHLIVRAILALGLMSVSFFMIMTLRLGLPSILSGIIIGFIILLISIYIIVSWMFHIPVILYEIPKVGYALKKSYNLTKFSWWRIVFIVFLILIICYAISTIITLSVSSIMYVFNLAGNTNYQNILQWMFLNEVLDSDNLYFYSIMTFVNLFMRGIVFPLWVIGYTLIYIDRKLQVDREFDIQN